MEVHIFYWTVSGATCFSTCQKAAWIMIFGNTR